MKNRRIQIGVDTPQQRSRRLLPPVAWRAFCLAIALALLASALTQPAYAAGSITVSTVNDVVDGNTGSITALTTSPGADGRISLREAILASNNTASIAASMNVINLPAGTYTLGNVGAVEL